MIHSLLAILCWLAVLWELPRIDFGTWRARYSFLAFISIALVATFRNPEWALIIDRWANLPDLGRVLEYLSTTGVGTAWGLVCLGLAPPEIKSRRWILGLAPLTIFAMFLLWKLEIAGGQPVQSYLYRTNDYSLAITLTAQAYLFATLAGIGMPTMICRFKNESGSPALRLRLGMLASSQIFASVMVGAVLGLYSLVLHDRLPRNYHSPVITLLIALTVLTYSASLLPLRLYAYLAVAINHFRQLWQIWHIRHLEQRTAHLLNITSISVSLFEAILIPDYILYNLVTTIVDRHKPLRANEITAAQALASNFDKISARVHTYPEVVEEFQRISHMPINVNTPTSASTPVQSPPLERLAHILSYLLHPAVLMVVSVILISHQARNNLTLTLMDVTILVAGLMPGLLYIYFKTRRGDFSHYHLLFKEERRVVLPLLLMGMVGSFTLYTLTGAPAFMLREMLVGLLAGLGAVLISRFWKMSLHATVAMGCAALCIPLSVMTVLILGILGIIVGLSRLVVRHHTPAQVVVGWLYGFGITSLLVWFLILRTSV